MTQSDPGKSCAPISRALPKVGELQGIMFERSDMEPGHNKSLTVVVPWVQEHPTKLEVYTSRGFRALLARDTFHTGYITTVNAAAAMVETEWMLLWNSDAVLLFNGPDIERALEALPLDVMVVAPAKIVEGHETRVADDGPAATLGPQDVIHTHVNMIDTGPLWVRMPIATESIYPSFEVTGSAYSPLFAVRTKWFTELGGLSMRYHPGYYEDADFWRMTRRMGGKTAILPGLGYAHNGQSSFKAVHGEGPLQLHLEENLRRYHLRWGTLEPEAIPSESSS